jgi:protein SHQ1
MITPKFECSQTEEVVIVKIYTPHLKMSEMEYHIEKFMFRFYLKPYFLRLTFDHELSNSGKDKSSLDIDSGTVTIELPKMVIGEHFDNLNMLTSLLSNPTMKPRTSLIEEIDPMDEHNPIDINSINFFEQTPRQDDLLLSSEITYGFDSKYSGYFKGHQGESIFELLDLKNPETTSKGERTIARIKDEFAQFSPEYYIEDLIEQNPKDSRIFKMDLTKWSDNEQTQLSNLPKKSYILTHPSLVYITLVDILCSYCYHMRMSDESNAESTWTISKLSSALCWLEEFPTIDKCLLSFIRRVATFPLRRNFDLAIESVIDAIKVLRNGKMCVLKCLLDMKYMFDRDTEKYLFSKLFVDDYCVWIQKEQNETLVKLAEKMEFVGKAIRKSDTGFNLDKLEQIYEECKTEGVFEKREEDFVFNGDEIVEDPEDPDENVEIYEYSLDE